MMRCETVALSVTARVTYKRGRILPVIAKPSLSEEAADESLMERRSLFFSLSQGVPRSFTLLFLWRRELPSFLDNSSFLSITGACASVAPFGRTAIS